MAPQELLQEVNQVEATEYLGCFETAAGDEYDIEIAHEDGADLFLLHRLDTESAEYPSSHTIQPASLRAAVRCFENETDVGAESHPVHFDVPYLAPQLPIRIKSAFLQTIIAQADERYPLSTHGAEVDLDADVADKETQKLFESLGFTAITQTEEHLILVKPAEIVESKEEVAETPQAIAA